MGKELVSLTSSMTSSISLSVCLFVRLSAQVISCPDADNKRYTVLPIGDTDTYGASLCCLVPFLWVFVLTWESSLLKPTIH